VGKIVSIEFEIVRGPKAPNACLSTPYEETIFIFVVLYLGGLDYFDIQNTHD
jgi:hypothetical protein